MESATLIVSFDISGHVQKWSNIPDLPLHHQQLAVIDFNSYISQHIVQSEFFSIVLHVCSCLTLIVVSRTCCSSGKVTTWHCGASRNSSPRWSTLSPGVTPLVATSKRSMHRFHSLRYFVMFLMFPLCICVRECACMHA